MLHDVPVMIEVYFADKGLRVEPDLISKEHFKLVKLTPKEKKELLIIRQIEDE